MRSLYTLLFLTMTLLVGCSEKKDTFVDYETIEKDDAFRKTITSGNFVKLSGGYTYYEYADNKSDTILVMVHGFSVPSYIWDSTYHAAIKRGYSALRYDTYGRGYSDNPDVVYDVAFFSQQLKELLDALHIDKPVTLAGLSDGGRTISAFAFQYPAKVKNLVYVDAVGFETIPADTNRVNVVTDEEIQAFKKNRYPTMAAGQMTDFYDSIPFRGWDKKYIEVMRYKGFVRALLSTLKNRTNLENEQLRIADSGIPVFAIWGEQDKVVVLNDVRAAMMERIPEIKLTVVPNAGHLPHMEQTQVFNKILFDGVIRKEVNLSR